MSAYGPDDSGSREHQNSRSHIEDVVSLRSLKEDDCFTNRGRLNCPPWARGVYGGQIMAQALLAGYETVTAEFMVHSIHCHFLKAAQPQTSVVYRVERTPHAHALSQHEHKRLLIDGAWIGDEEVCES
uniref:Acyl-CoA thioesterase-like N-terminal HotDog domain-containing protein n=1 Tax=Fusarium oxysporum (strain Fo5176) TaxID=660025 RepID=A0A0C4DIT9_FUSOF